MGGNSSVQLDENEIEIANKQINKVQNICDTVIKSQNKNNQTAINSADINITGSTVKDLVIDQNNIQTNVVKNLSSISNALKATTDATQKSNLQKQLENVTEQTANLMGVNSDVSKTDTKTKIKNTVINDTLNQYNTVIETGNFNQQEVENKLKLTIENADVQNAAIKQSNNQGNDTTTQSDSAGKTEVANKTDQAEDITNTTTNTTKNESGVDVGKIMIVVGCVAGAALIITVPIVVVQARKTATDPNLKGNVEAATQLVSAIKPGIGAGYNFGGAPPKTPAQQKRSTLNWVLLVILLLLIISCILTFYYTHKQQINLTDLIKNLKSSNQQPTNDIEAAVQETAAPEAKK